MVRAVWPSAFGKAREQIEHMGELARFIRAGASGEGAELEIFAHRQLAEQAAAFGHQRQAFLDDIVRRQAANVVAMEQHAAVCALRDQPGEGLQQR